MTGHGHVKQKYQLKQTNVKAMVTHKGYQHLPFNKAIILKEMIKSLQKIIKFYLLNHNLKKSPFWGPYKTVNN
jgi:hypothetical protein